MSKQHITRRQALRAAGGACAAYLVLPGVTDLIAAPGTAIAASSCARLTADLTEGPYWVNTMLRRSDVRANSHSPGSSRQAGVPLDLYINVVDRAPVGRSTPSPSTSGTPTRMACTPMSPPRWPGAARAFPPAT